MIGVYYTVIFHFSSIYLSEQYPSCKAHSCLTIMCSTYHRRCTSGYFGEGNTRQQSRNGKVVPYLTGVPSRRLCQCYCCCLIYLLVQRITRIQGEVKVSRCALSCILPVVLCFVLVAFTESVRGQALPFKKTYIITSGL